MKSYTSQLGSSRDLYEFYIPDETAQQLMPEEAYFQLKRLVDGLA